MRKLRTNSLGELNNNYSFKPKKNKHKKFEMDEIGNMQGNSFAEHTDSKRLEMENVGGSSRFE